MIARVSQAIRQAGGSIIDSRFFSNLTLFISAEISAAGLSALRDTLLATQLNFATQSLASLDRQIERCAASVTENPAVSFHLVVTFIHSEPDLRITVPAVPG